MKEGSDLLNHLIIPKFSHYVTTPRNASCVVIDSTRLMVEILGGAIGSQGEYAQSEYSSTLLIEDGISLVVRYRREKDNQYRPMCVLSCSVGKDLNNLSVIQLQGSKARGAFRFFSSFRTVDFFLDLLEKSFLQKGVTISVKPVPTGLEDASYGSYAYTRYELLRTGIQGRMRKCCLGDV